MLVGIVPRARLVEDYRANGALTGLHGQVVQGVHLAADRLNLLGQANAPRAVNVHEPLRHDEVIAPVREDVNQPAYSQNQFLFQLIEGHDVLGPLIPARAIILHIHAELAKPVENNQLIQIPLRVDGYSGLGCLLVGHLIGLGGRSAFGQSAQIIELVLNYRSVQLALVAHVQKFVYGQVQTPNKWFAGYVSRASRNNPILQIFNDDVGAVVLDKFLVLLLDLRHGNDYRHAALRVCNFLLNHDCDVALYGPVARHPRRGYDGCAEDVLLQQVDIQFFV